MPKQAVNIIIDSRRRIDGGDRTWSAISVLLHVTLALSLALGVAYGRHRKAMEPRVYRVSIASLPGSANANMSRKRPRVRSATVSQPVLKSEKKAKPAKSGTEKKSRKQPAQPKPKPAIGINTRKQEPPAPRESVPKPLLDAPIASGAKRDSHATGGDTSPRVGFTSQGSIFDVDGANFEYSYYLGLVQDRIGSNWVRTYVGKGKVKIYFRIRKNGHIQSVMIEESSGDPGLDRLALRAVTASDPLPPLPEGYTGSVLGIHIWFNYEE